MDTRGFDVSRLGRTDLDLAGELLGMFGQVFGDEETYTGARPGPGYLERLLGDEDIIALAALADGRVVGGLVAYTLHKLERERSEVCIYDLGVLAQYRRRGIATALIDGVRTIAAGRGAHAVFVQADVGDQPAIALYTRLGRREEVLHFDIPVR